jgi:hypothetical protein
MLRPTLCIYWRKICSDGTMISSSSATGEGKQTVSDWVSQFKTFNDSIGNAAKNVFNMIDMWSFKAVVNNLKSEDYDVVKSAVEQLVKEKRPLSIPPLYFVSQAHPNTHVRKIALKALQDLGVDQEVEKITKGKTVEEATKVLIETYGNYKQK